MLTEKTSRIISSIQERKGTARSQDNRTFTSTEDKDDGEVTWKKASNMDLILPLVLNAHSLGLGGFHASLLITLVNLIAESERNLLPPNLKELASRINLGQSTLERHVSQLKELGFIEVDKNLDDRGFARNIYRFSGLIDKLHGLGIEI